jgi:ribonuclease J
MTKYTDKPSPKDELVFLPLGGSNEIGMNFNLYGYGPAHAASGSSSTWA